MKLEWFHQPKPTTQEVRNKKTYYYRTQSRRSDKCHIPWKLGQPILPLCFAALGRWVLVAQIALLARCQLRHQRSNVYKTIHQTKLKAKYTVNTNLCATPVQSKYLLLPSLWFPPFLVFLYLSLAVQMQLLPLPAAWVIPCFPLTNKSGVIIMMTFDLCAHNYIQNLNLQRRTDWSIWWPN